MMKKMLLLYALLLGAMLYSQTTLATYQFNNNLNPSNPPTPIGNPSLLYYNANGTLGSANYENGWLFGWGSNMLYTTASGSYVELNLDTTSYSGITIDWHGELELGYTEVGTWALEIWKAGVWTNVDNMVLKNKPVFIFPDQDSENRSFTFDSYADNNANLKIRIRATGLNDKIRLDNLAITSRSPKIKVSGYNTTNMLTQIPVNAAAASLYGTDFGIVITSSLTATGYADRVFRIQNNGAATLNISAINFTGDNPADFAVTGTFPATVNAGTTKDFTVRFNAESDGKSSALLNIVSNANPSPYSYYVEGRGASCKSEDLVFKNNTMESGTQSLPAVGTFTKVLGYSGANNATNANNLSTGFGTYLYGPNNNATSNYPLFTSSNNSWYVRGTSSTVNFGPVDVTNEKGVFIGFNLAAFATGISDKFVNSDVVSLEVLDPTSGLWSKELEIRGNNASKANDSRFGFNGGVGLLEAKYDGDNNPVVGANTYSSVKLKLPGSSDFTNLAFRITAFSSSTNKLWLIDDVSVSIANAIYKTYIGGSGTGWINAKNQTTTEPILEEKAIIDASFIGNLIACACEVLPGKSVLINAGNSVTLEGTLTNNGSFTIESDGNLIQNDNRAANYGNITAKRIIKVGAARNQYNYLGTPVNFASGETFKTIYPGTTFVLYHNETNNMFYNSSGVNIPGRGLAVKEPTGSGATNVTATYKGVPQNGKILFPVANKDANPAVTTFGYNLVGNPYPSNINLLKLYEINGGKTGASPIASPNISPTFYFWDNNGNGQFTQQGNGYLGQAYAIFNVLSGSTGTGTKSSLGTKVPTSIVKVGQGFMTRTLLSNYDFVFNNSIRTSATSAADFLGKGNSNVQDDRYWLQLTAPSGITSTIAVVHYASGNNAFGPEDSRSMGGSDAIYTMVENEKIAIEGRSSFANTDRISLGTKHFATGNYTIGLDDKEGIFANGQSIYLKDLQTGIITNLSDGNYTFQANAGESTGRFEIIYKPESVLATNQTVKESVIVYRDGTDFIVKAENKKITALEVYDSVGRLIYSAKPNAVKVTVPTDRMLNGVYILKIDQGGTVTTKKVIR